MTEPEIPEPAAAPCAAGHCELQLTWAWRPGEAHVVLHPQPMADSDDGPQVAAPAHQPPVEVERRLKWRCRNCGKLHALSELVFLPSAGGVAALSGQRK